MYMLISEFAVMYAYTLLYEGCKLENFVDEKPHFNVVECVSACMYVTSKCMLLLPYIFIYSCVC